MFACVVYVVLLPQCLYAKAHLNIHEKELFMSHSASLSLNVAPLRPPLMHRHYLLLECTSLIYLCTCFFRFVLVGAKTAATT